MTRPDWGHSHCQQLSGGRSRRALAGLDALGRVLERGGVATEVVRVGDALQQQQQRQQRSAKRPRERRLPPRSDPRLACGVRP